MAFSLPLGVVGQAEISRLLREIQSLEDFFIAARARQAGTPVQPVRATRLLEQLAQDNQLNLLEAKDRRNLTGELSQLQQTAPSLHISFATEPSAKILERILAWLRDNVHPYTLLQVGLQPSIAAGCVLRTPNKVFDMSLRRNLDGQRDYLLELIKGAVHGH